MWKNIYFHVVAIIFLFMLVFTPSVLAAEIIQVVKVSAEDAIAVIKEGSGQLKIYRMGDQLTGFGKIVQISQDRLVLENNSAEGMETNIIQINGQEQEVKRIHKKMIGTPPLQTTVNAEKATIVK